MVKQLSTGQDVVHSGIRLPRDMYEKLRAAPLGLSEEIRRRVAWSFEQDEIKAETRELASDIAEIAGELDRQARAEWHKHRRTHEALRAAIDEWLQMCEPPDKGTAADVLFGPADPQSAGRMAARFYQRLKTVRAEALRQIDKSYGATRRGRERKIGQLARYIKARGEKP